MYLNNVKLFAKHKYGFEDEEIVNVKIVLVQNSKGEDLNEENGDTISFLVEHVDPEKSAYIILCLMPDGKLIYRAPLDDLEIEFLDNERNKDGASL